MKILTAAKYIDQPAVLSKLHSKMPAVLTGTGAAVWGYETFHKQKDHPHKARKAFKNAVTIASAAGASFVGVRGLKIGGKTIFKGLMEYTPIEKVLKNQAQAIDKFLSTRNLDDETLEKTLKNAKNRKFSLSDIEIISDRLPKDKKSKEFLHEILPEPENLSSKEIFGEIKRLSLIGLIPVAGGVAGGITSDIITGTGSQKKTANKVKEDRKSVV